MKSILKVLIAAVFSIVVVGVPYNEVQAQSKIISKQREKKHKNLYKDKVKELKKEGWKISGSSKTLEVALLDHYDALMQEDGLQEFVGEVSQCRSLNVGRQRAITNAQNAYASLAAGNIRGKVTDEITATDDVESEIFIAAYEKYVSAQVGGALIPSFAIYKDNGATKEYKLFFILNESKAGVARQQAMKKAAKEAGLSAAVGEEISKFINEDFPLDN